MKESIALIGMMGSGKTTIGKALSTKLKMLYIDTDDLVEYNYAPIKEIFQLFGEEGFRKYEGKAVSQASTFTNTVLSTGGGVVLSKKNMDKLKENYIIVYLTAKANTILERTSGDKSRPLLQNNPKETVEKLLTERIPLYESYADFSVVTDNRSVKNIVNEIIRKLKRMYIN